MELSILINKEEGGSLEFQKEICRCDGKDWIIVTVCGKPGEHCSIKVDLCDLLCAVEKLGCCPQKE
jgi:hypothetical protein